MKINEAVEMYIKMRDKKAQMKAEFDASVAPLTEKMDKLEIKLLQAFDQLGMDSVKTEFGTAYTTVRTSASVADKDTFMNFVKEQGEWSLLEIRAAREAGEEPPYHFIEVMACPGGCVGGGGVRGGGARGGADRGPPWPALRAWGGRGGRGRAVSVRLCCWRGSRGFHYGWGWRRGFYYGWHWSWCRHWRRRRRRNLCRRHTSFQSIHKGWSRWSRIKCLR
jgi:hypothetical protein